MSTGSQAIERRDSALYQRNKKRLYGSYDEIMQQSSNIVGNITLSNNLLKRSTDRFERSGKWTSEEENFANRLIVEFEAGSLHDCEEGCTLRSYLARRLRCAPMRISKKFAGRCIGKLVFARRSNIHVMDAGNTTLHELEILYHKSYQSLGESESPDQSNHEDDISISDSYGSSSGTTSSTDIDRKYSFVSKKVDNLRKKRKSMHHSSFLDQDHMKSLSSGSDFFFVNTNHGDDFMGVDLFDSDSFANDVQLNSQLCHDQPLDLNNTPQLEAEEWLDVLSFFCGEENGSSFQVIKSGELRRIRSNVSLPVC